MDGNASLDCVIVGAGFAGLTAARVLTACGLRVVVVEGRDRIGGRAHTSTLPADPDRNLPCIPVECGCNYIHGCCEQNPLFALASEIGIPTAICPADLSGRFGGWESGEVAEWRDPEKNGELISFNEVMDACFLLEQARYGVQVAENKKENEGKNIAEVFDEALETVVKMRYEKNYRATPELSSRERGIVFSLRGRHFGYVSATARMPLCALPTSTSHRHALEIFTDPGWPVNEPQATRGTENAVKKRLQIIKSLKKGLDAAVVDKVQSLGEDRLVLGGGFKMFIDFLAEGVDIIQGDRVASITQKDGQSTSNTNEDDQVIVKTASGRVLTAPNVIVTVPCGVLAALSEESAIEFIPPLPEEKVLAIKRLSIPTMGATTHEKVILRWDLSAKFVKDVLDPPGASLQLATTDTRFHFLNLHKYGRLGCILCHIWADAQWKEHADLHDEEIVAAVVDALRCMYPSTEKQRGCCGPNRKSSTSVEDPIQWHVTRWSKDPFACGAYSEIQGIGGGERDRELYAESEGRILFAGEGAIPSDCGAQCTHGAFLSGVSTAVEVYYSQKGNLQGIPSHVSPETFLGDGPMGIDVAATIAVLMDRQESRGIKRHHE